MAGPLAIAVIAAGGIAGAGGAVYVGHDAMRSNPEISGDTCTTMDGVPLETAYEDSSIIVLQNAIMEKAGVEIIGGADGNFAAASCISFGIGQEGLGVQKDYKLGPQTAGVLGIELDELVFKNGEYQIANDEIVGGICDVTDEASTLIGDGDTTLNIKEKMAVQRGLVNAGYPLIIDGKIGPETSSAIVEFQRDSEIKDDCIVGNITMSHLMEHMDPLDTYRVESSSSTIEEEQETLLRNCIYSVISELEVERLLGEPGTTSEQLCGAVSKFQKENGLVVDGNVGPVTAMKMIELAKNPCGIYGESSENCVLGIQKNRNLGNTYVVENGEITYTTSSRFGNNDRGRRTPEGDFDVQRSIKGEHISSECIDENGDGFVCMWNPLYIDGGVAGHGTKGPNNPNGSLGCLGYDIASSELIFAKYEQGILTKFVIVDFQRPDYKQYN